MEELKKAFYEVMYKYEKYFGEDGVMANLNAWATAKAPLLELLRQHPNWNEDAKAVVLEFQEGRGIERDVVDEVAFGMMEIADEIIPFESKDAFRLVFNAAIGEYSQTLTEPTLELIRENAQIKCAAGEKTSRIIGKICRKFGISTHASYNNAFARLSDALNPLLMEKTAVLSLHPCDFLEMSSRTNSWSSCHNLEDGGYQGGTLSYLADDVSMIFFTVDPEVKDHFYRAARRTRQMFFFQDNCLYQSRLYPSETQALIDQNREIVHKIMATCLGVPNLWVLKTKRPDINCCESALHSTHYPDYTYYGNLSFIKGTENIPKMIIGRQPLCVGCGKPYNGHHTIKCNCDYTVVCLECGRTVLRENARYENGAYYCSACLHVCAACGRICKEEMYPAFDRKGRMMEVCRECYERSQEPCFACSVRNVCAIVGNMFCHQATLRPVQQQEVT